MSVFSTLSHWPGEVAAAVVSPDGAVHRHGDTARPFAVASITKLYAAMAVLVAHEEGTVGLDETVAPFDATVADLLAHSGGIEPDARRVMTTARTRRIYSTAAYDIVADLVAERAGMTFAAYAGEAVAAPLGMQATRLDGSAGKDLVSTVDDLLALADAWRRPTLVDSTTLERATRPHLHDLDGVVPGYGRHRPNPWGLGPEIRDAKAPHWTATGNHPTTFGHFGRSGTMLWIDPVAQVIAIALSTEPFGPWAVESWPPFGAAALATATR